MANMAAQPGGGSARDRAPVDFVIIGAMRAGTTTLHSVLSRHPQISMSRDKETDFFIPGRNYGRGLQWYLDQFDPALPIRGEASPNYAKLRDFPDVPQTLSRHAPDARLVYVVRDPVRRAVSQYAHSWNMGMALPPPAQLADTHEYLSILDISSYARQLDPWRALFGPKRILIVDFDALLADPQAQFDRICAHVGADPMPVAALAAHNATSELSRVPRPLLRLAQGPLRPLLTRLLDQRMRDRLRGLAAFGPDRKPPEFPAPLLARLRQDLAEDAARFRHLSGMDFPHWSV